MQWLSRILTKATKPIPPHPDLTVTATDDHIEFWDGTKRVFSIVSALPASKELALLVDEPVAGWLKPSEVRALIVALERLEKGLR